MAETLSWLGEDSSLSAMVRESADRAVAAYVKDPTLVREHVNIERATAEGGYERRQVYELVQNGADALLQTKELHGSGRIQVLLTREALYCANEGAPITPEGLEALLHSHLSAKRGFEIGRFGLGFKSVLAVSDRPCVFSRTVSFEFDPEYSAELIQKAVGTTFESYPILRIARTLDASSEARSDKVLAELMSWATTVVKLPRTRHAEHLADDFRKFPEEFLLFSNHVGSVRFFAPNERIDRLIELQRNEDGSISLSDRTKTRRWRVVSSTQRLSNKALRGAGEFSERAEVPLHWAVPLEHSPGRGSFWAFFPTHYETTLSGILNAPWKTQEDRQNLLEGDFNSELIDSAAQMIVAHCSELATTEDPALHLDKFPARGRESPNWADARLTEKVYEIASQAGRCLPDLDGRLREASELNLHPRVAAEALDLWAEVPGRPSNWCHRSVETRERRSRVERIVGRPASETSEWLKALLKVKTVEASIAAIRILASLGDEQLSRETEAVLTADSRWVTPDPQVIFLLDEPREVVANLKVVHPEVAARPEAATALEALGIRRLDALGELDAALALPIGKWESEDWVRFWQLTRRIPVDTCVQLLATREVDKKIQARTKGKAFRRVLSALLPGEVVSDRAGDAHSTIDVEYHSGDLELLEKLGAVTAPRGGVDVGAEAWFGQYRDTQRKAYVDQLPASGPKPNPEYLEFDQREAVGPLGVLIGLELPAKARFTRLALSQPGALTPWSMRHRTQQHYPRLPVQNPTVWMLRGYGAVETSRGFRRCTDSFGAALARWRHWLPVANLDAGTCDALGICNDLHAVSTRSWSDALALALSSEEGSEELGSLYAQAARASIPAPLSLRAIGSDDLNKPNSVAVILVSDIQARQELEATGEPFVLVDDPTDVAELLQRWKLIKPKPVRIEVVGVEPREPEGAADAFPLLPLYVPGDALRDLTIVRAAEVEVRAFRKNGTATRAVPSQWDGNRLVVDDDLPEGDLLDLVLEKAGISLDTAGREAILEQRAIDTVESLKKTCRTAHSDTERLLTLIGLDRLTAALPIGLTQAVTSSRGRGLSPNEVSDLVLAVHGIDVLNQFRGVLAEHSMAVPTLNGGSKARRFVADLGFPLAFAGARPEPRDPLLRVDSPPILPPLHDYQSGLAERVREMLLRSSDKRGLLSLPTGAGKTRVAAEALIQSAMDGELRGPVVWIAQSDELCEQAVQTWSYIWRAIGAGGTLGVSRLWSTNEVEQTDDFLQVVVATIDKLAVVEGDPDYEWLTSADCVVVDEAHGATTPSYTTVLRWLGFTGRHSREGANLLGLTATPFRGVSERETEQLVARFGRYRLDHDVFNDDPYAELQEIGVLAKVDHKVLGGSRLRLSLDELENLRQLRKLPKQVEQRVGEDQDRNNVLLDEVRSFPDDWPCLLFCASVQHAELMAALLTLEGIRAESISSATDVGRRRHAIEEFRRGRIRVLTNYGVLTQGFDAPKVQAIVVARPTYSPNVYQQMIGRGLRGPANGGSDTCLIVNVEDTIEQFGEQLAFRQFEHLWVRR